MSGDIADFLESIVGPRTLRYFMVLLSIVFGLLLIGPVFSSMYDIHWIEDIGLLLADNPMALLQLAGIFASITVLVIAAPIVKKHLDQL